MKICVYCKTENRPETIFCQHCRRPLPTAPRPPRIAFMWLLGVTLLLGLGAFLFLPASLAVPMTQPPSSAPTNGLEPNRIREAVTLQSCTGDNIRIHRRPDTQSEMVGRIFIGDCLTILARTQDSSWLYVVSDDDQPGWVSASQVKDAGDITQVSIRDESAMTNVARPTLASLEPAAGAETPSAISSYVVPCAASADRLGDNVTCRVETAYCDYLPEAEGSPTFCNDHPHPDQAFALVAYDKDWSDYDGMCIIVSGYLELDRGILRIQAFHRNQVSSCH